MARRGGTGKATRGEKNLSSERRVLYHGRVVELALETAVLPDGKRVPLEVVRHPGGAAAVAVDSQGRVCLVRQYRHAGGGWLWELPAGKLEPGEPPLATARRELREEAGVTAASWVDLGEILATPGFCDERIHLFLAREPSLVPPRPEADELLEPHWISFDQALGWARSGEIVDAKTVVGLFRAAARLSG